jgi:hypothetical protein
VGWIQRELLPPGRSRPIIGACATDVSLQAATSRDWLLNMARLRSTVLLVQYPQVAMCTQP